MFGCGDGVGKMRASAMLTWQDSASGQASSGVRRCCPPARLGCNASALLVRFWHAPHPWTLAVAPRYHSPRSWLRPARSTRLVARRDRRRPVAARRARSHVLRHALQGHMDERPPRRRLPQGERSSLQLGKRQRLFVRSRACAAQSGDTNEGYDALTQRPDRSLIKLEPGARLDGVAVTLIQPLTRPDPRCRRCLCPPGYEKPASGPTTNFVGNHMTQVNAACQLARAARD